MTTDAIRSMVSSIAAGPTLQFTPMTSAPNCSSIGVNVSGGVPSRRVAVFFGRDLGDDRQRSRRPADGANRGAELVDVAERLEHEQVDAAVGQSRRLLAEPGLGLVEAGLAPGLDAHAQRPDGAGDVGGVTRRVTRDAGALRR